jgi:cobalt-zinc-cadmium efflux system protein
MAHAHHHHTDHSDHSHSSFNLAFAVAVFFNLAFAIVELIYGVIANSVSLVAEAGHTFGDVLGLLLSWGALFLTTKAATDKYSYGFKRTSILAAILNALILVGMSAIIAYEAINKLILVQTVQENIIIIVAAIGIFINGGTALLFMRGRKEDLNIKSAYLHLAYDALISIGVVVAGILIAITGWVQIDPILGLIIVIMIVAGTWGLLRESINLLLDAVPHTIEKSNVENYLASLEGVSAVHDLHIWGLSTREIALTVHLMMPEKTMTDEDVEKINLELKEKFNINHVTIQVEKGSGNNVCGQLYAC